MDHATATVCYTALRREVAVRDNTAMCQDDLAPGPLATSRLPDHDGTITFQEPQGASHRNAGLPQPPHTDHRLVGTGLPRVDSRVLGTGTGRIPV